MGSVTFTFIPNRRFRGSGFGNGLARLVATPSVDVEWTREHALYRLDSHFQLALFYTSLTWDAVFRSRRTLAHIICHGLDLPPDFFLR